MSKEWFLSCEPISSTPVHFFTLAPRWQGAIVNFCTLPHRVAIRWNQGTTSRWPLVFLFLTILLKARTQITISGMKVKMENNFNKLKYLQTENPGWALHITSTASEWIMFISFDIFLLTFWQDFSSLSLNINCDNKHEIINKLWHKILSTIYLPLHQSCVWFPPGDRFAEND